MNKSEVIVAPELESLVEERSKLWTAYDRAQGDYSVLKSAATSLGTSGQVTEVENLTADGSPPDEINAAIRAVNEGTKQLERLQVQISNKAGQITTVRENAASARNMMIIGIIIVVAILAFFLFRIMAG